MAGIPLQTCVSLPIHWMDGGAGDQTLGLLYVRLELYTLSYISSRPLLVHLCTPVLVGLFIQIQILPYLFVLIMPNFTPPLRFSPLPLEIYAVYAT